jgi:Formyl transferase
MTLMSAPPERQAVLIGGESLLIECAQTLQSAGFGIAAVVSRAAAVRRWAASQNLALFSEPSQLLSAEAPRGYAYLFSITNLDVLAAEVIALPTRAAINFHDGPLPEYAGLNTPVWALLNGEGQHGITWHLMAREVDRGDILAQRRFDLTDSESALSLSVKSKRRWARMSPRSRASSRSREVWSTARWCRARRRRRRSACTSARTGRWR